MPGLQIGDTLGFGPNKVPGCFSLIHIFFLVQIKILTIRKTSSLFLLAEMTKNYC